MNIRPVSDLRNHYPEVEKEVQESGPVFLTKNGRGSMVVMSFEQYRRANETVEAALDAADRQAATMPLRYTHDQVFGSFELKNPSAAERLVDSVEAGIFEHLKNPTMAATYRTTRERPLPYYMFAVGNYMVFYVVIDDVVEVRRFLYKARNIEAIIWGTV